MTKPNSYLALITVFFTAMAAAVSSSASSLSDEKMTANIVARVNEGMPQAIDELEHVVNINSGTLNKPGVYKVGKVFRQQFDDLGFSTEWLEGAAFDRAGHLVANYGDQGPKVLLIGHLDTVFSENDAFQKFKKLDGDRVAGPGITDMKGGNMIIVAALRALKAEGVLDNLQLRVVLTGDEERSGRPLSLSKKAIVDGGKWADIALGFEDGDSNIKTAVIARRGSVSWQLSVSGKAAHSSQIFSDDIGYGASFETARILNEFRLQLAGVGNISLNPGLLVAGTEVGSLPEQARAKVFGKTNVVAKTAVVHGGIRTLSEQELQNAKDIMQAIVAQNLAHTSATLSFNEGYPAMSPTAANRQLLSLYSEVSESLGYGPVAAVNPRNAGAADISFAANHVDMALDGLGLMGSGGHTKDEVADMSSFAKNTHKAAVLLYRLSQLSD